MFSGVDALVCTASTVVRLSAYTFLRWIPGHHFSPIIVASLLVYLTTIAVYTTSFGPSLRDSFPKLFRHTNSQKRSDAAQPDNDHEPIVYDDERTILKILLLGIPNWREWEFSYVTIAVNILLALLSLDLVFRAPILHPSDDVSFSRVGFVDSSTAKVLVREPRSSELPLHVYLQGPHESSWTIADTIYWLSEQTDYTHPIIFSNLVPETEYRYALSNSLEGSFTTAPLAGSPASRSLTFLTSSCIKANFPYNPFSHSLAIHGFKYVTKVIQSLPQMPSFMLFLGDFIYVDVPLRLSSSVDHYRSEYRRVYASPSWSLPGLSMPWLHVLDDHEIANDWAGGNSTDPFPAASDPFIHYHVAVNPPIPTSASSLAQDNITFFEFTQGPASFFMLDTRRYRTAPEPIADSSLRKSDSMHGRSAEPQTTHTMLGPVQLQALLDFLSTAPAPGVEFKFVISSVPFTKNWRVGTSDSWGGFLTERKKVLRAMHEAEHRYGVRIVILSGDRHEFAAIRFPPSQMDASSSSQSQGQNTHADAGPHEFSVGPLSMFYLPIRTFKQVDDEDMAISYIPNGNSKVGAITIEPSSSRPGEILTSRATLRFTLFVDGKESFTYNLTSPAPTFRGSWFDRNELWS